MHIPAGVFFQGVIDELVHIALQRPIAASRVRIEATARSHRDIGRPLHGLDGKVPRRLHDDVTLATDPGNEGGPIFVIMPPAWLTLLAATTRPSAQRLLPTLLRLAF